MTDTERLEALRNLFMAGDQLSAGSRKILGLLLSNKRGSCNYQDIIDTFGTYRSTAWRWIAEAKREGLIKGRRKTMLIDDIYLEKLQELAERKRS